MTQQINPIEPIKYNLFDTHTTLNDAMNSVLSEYPEHDQQTLFSLIMSYHNTLIDNIDFKNATAGIV